MWVVTIFERVRGTPDFLLIFVAVLKCVFKECSVGFGFVLG